MKKKLTTVLCFIVGTMLQLTANPIVKYGFETNQNPDDGSCGFAGWQYSQNYSVIIGLQDATKARTGSGLLYVNNAIHNGNFWERESVMTNIGVTENSSYRVTFYIKGDNSIKEGDERGRFIVNPQIQTSTGFPSINAGQGNDFNLWDQMNFNPSTWTRQSFNFFYSTDAELGNINPGKMRLVFNLFTKGEYLIDDISIEKSSIAGIRFKGNKVEVDFGYKIDLQSFGEAIAIVPTDKLVVKVNGSPVAVNSAKIPVSTLEIMLDRSLNPTDIVTVDYTNTDDENLRLYYLEQKHPGFNDPNDEWAVWNFTNEAAYYDADLIFPSEIEPDPEPSFINIAQNGGFESGVYSTDADKLMRVVNPSEARTGNGYLKVLTNAGGNVWDKAVMLNTDAIESGKQYTLSCWAKTTAANPQIALSVSDAAYGPLNPDYSSQKTFSITSPEWTKYEFKFTASKAEATPKLAVQGGGATGDVWIDDVELMVEKNTSGIELKTQSQDYIRVTGDYIYVTGIKSDYVVTVFRPTGEVVLQTTLTGEAELPIMNLPSGIYFVQLHHNGQNFRTNFLK